MPRLRPAEQALKQLTTISRQPYVCRSCRAQSIRQLHSSPIARADVPFFKRVQNTLFGTKESKEAEKQQEENYQKKVEEQVQREDPFSDLEVKTDSRGRQYEVAALVDTSISKEYVPATHWKGLERVGSEEWIKERADRGDEYTGFVPEKRTNLADWQWEKYLHHMAVEILTLQKAGRNVNDITLARSRRIPKKWILGAKINIDDIRGNASAEFHKAEWEPEVLSAMSDDAEVERDSFLDPRYQGHDGHTKGYSRDDAWKRVPLHDASVKLVILKRVLQLTGHRIPDHAISNAKTFEDIYDALKTRERPKRLANSTQAQRLGRTPNVAVHSRRRTPIHKEKEVGRWKVIEEELLARDLPVTGSRWQDAKNKITA